MAWTCKCGASVPPSGAIIGFHGKRDTHPLLCRDCTAALGVPGLLEEWDRRVAAEAERRAALRKAS